MIRRWRATARMVQRSQYYPRAVNCWSRVPSSQAPSRIWSTRRSGLRIRSIRDCSRLAAQSWTQYSEQPQGSHTLRPVMLSWPGFKPSSWTQWVLSCTSSANWSRLRRAWLLKTPRWRYSMPFVCWAMQSALISTIRRTKVLKALNPDIQDLASEEGHFTEDAPKLFRGGFEKAMKERAESIKILPKTSTAGSSKGGHSQPKKFFFFWLAIALEKSNQSYNAPYQLSSACKEDLDWWTNQLIYAGTGRVW